MARGLLWTTLDEAMGNFFDVLHTTERSQVVLMTVEPGRVAGGPNSHAASDQTSLVVEGEALVRLWEEGPDGEPTERKAPPGTLMHIPAGMVHWVKSVGSEPLVYLSVYAPPEY